MNWAGSPEEAPGVPQPGGLPVGRWLRHPERGGARAPAGLGVLAQGAPGGGLRDPPMGPGVGPRPGRAPPGGVKPPGGHPERCGPERPAAALPVAL